MIHVWPQERKRLGDSIEVRTIIELPTDRRELYYQIPASWESALTDSCDPFAIATVFLAMKHKEDLYIHGTVSPSLLRNLEEFQAIWTSWKPERYQFKSMTVDFEKEVATPTEQAIVSFSGGLDACFSVHRHVYRLHGRRTRSIGAALMIHGFDVPENKPEAFRAAFESADRILKTVDIRLIPLRTNWKDLAMEWEDAHAAGIVSCLALFSRGFNSAILAGGESHADLARNIPWGSNPLTDVLLSSDSFRIQHDSGEFNRVQKASQLLQWKAALENLRVCWEGPLTGRNCGKCEKCIRTILDFRVVGGGCPLCFSSDVSDEQLHGINIRNMPQRLEIGYILAEANRRGLQDKSWVKILESKARDFDGGHTQRPFSSVDRLVQKLRHLIKDA